MTTPTRNSRTEELNFELQTANWKLLAKRGSVAGGMIAEASAQIGAGVLAGVGAFALLRRLVAGLLFHTSALDPTVIAAAAAGMLACALAAASWQSRRLANVSPALRLREETRG